MPVNAINLQVDFLSPGLQVDIKQACQNQGHHSEISLILYFVEDMGFEPMTSLL